MATRTVTGTVLKLNGAPWGGAKVKFCPVYDSYLLAPDSSYPIATVVVLTGENGEFSIDLAAGLSTPFEVTMPDDATFHIYVPEGSATTLEALRFAYDGVSPIPPPDLQDYVEAVMALTGVTIDIKEGNVLRVAGARALDFDASDFNVADAGSDRATVGLAYGTVAGTPAEGDHAHLSSKITDFTEAAQDAAGALATDSASVTLTYHDGVPSLVAQTVFGGTGVADTSSRSDHVHSEVTSVGFGIGSADGTNVIGVGTKHYFSVPFACTITGWRVMVSPNATVTLDIWKVASGTTLPTNSNSITASAKPGVTAAPAARSTSLTGWTTSIAAGDILAWEVETNDLAKFIGLSLELTKTI